MDKELFFFQVGCGNTANYAGLIEDNWADNFDLPGIPADTQWRGGLVDAQPDSVMEMAYRFGKNPRLTIINAGLAGTSKFSIFETRSFTEVDQEARFANASTYNDKIHSDFQSAFYCRAITLNQLFDIPVCYPENHDLHIDIGVRRYPIGLLSLDVQGSEVDIFLSYNWSVKPLLIEVEPHSKRAEEMVSEVLALNDYSPIRRRPDGTRRVNHLWRRND